MIKLVAFLTLVLSYKTLYGTDIACYDHPPLLKCNLSLTDSINGIEVPTSYFKKNVLTKFDVALPLFRLNSFFGYYAPISLDATLEHRLGKQFSLLIGVENNFGYILDGHGTTLYSLEAPLAIRYYYAANRRIRLQKSRNVFSSPYVCFQIQNTLFSQLWYDPIHNHVAELSPEQLSNYLFINKGAQGMVGQRPNLAQFFSVQWGFQKRIGRENFMDINLNIPIPYTYKQGYNMTTPAFINFRFGIAKWHF